MTNQVKGRALTNKTTAVVCRFLIEDVICRYGCVAMIATDQGVLDAHEATELFERLGVKISLTKTYNSEANGKVERRHELIVKSIACHVMFKSGIGHDSCHMHYGTIDVRTNW